MSQVVNKTVSVTELKEIEVTEYVRNVIIQPESGGLILWTVDSLDSNGNMVARDWFNIPTADVQEDKPDGSKTYYVNIRDKLWAKTLEIRALPETTVEEINAKNERTRKFNIELRDPEFVDPASVPVQE